MIVRLTPLWEGRFLLFGAGGVGSGLGHADSVEARDVAGDAAVEGFGDALAVLGLAELGCVVGIGEERNFGED